SLGEELLRVENLSLAGKFENVSFTLRAGEILGFAGLMGAGRTEVVETLFGIRNRTGGRIFVRGKEIDIRRPEDAIQNGLALVPEDRKQVGLILKSSVSDNISLVS
ncbi:MAG: ATP-binding cassette domain-containing protein, partial [Planctomycetes bacterium]|nr:ATP-binding cassette domain-containing protein [Planctomycetota bacterium]